jgi:hypothetical protein
MLADRLGLFDRLIGEKEGGSSAIDDYLYTDKYREEELGKMNDVP